MPRTRLLCALIGLLGWTTSLAAQPPAKDVLSLGKRIDELILNRAKADGIAVTGPTDHSTYIRRLSLDLIGKIPELISARDYLDNDDPDKRSVWVERYLKDPRFAQHFAAVYRGILLPSTNENAVNFQAGFELYLKDRFEKNIPYNTIAKEILTSTLGANVDRAFNSPAASSVAFFAAQQGKPEDLASATSRAFLGVKLDCAQCHSHPFASWTKDQFWEFAAFFNSDGNRLAARRTPKSAPAKAFEILIPETKKIVQAKFLDGVQPKAEGNSLSVVAEWVTAPQNPYFARTAADHLWSYFFGVSLLEPIVEPANGDAITHPELLDLLAKELIDHQFDLKFLIRAILHTQAYQRSSEGQGTPQGVRYFTHMPVRGTTPEQFFDSVCEAAGYKESSSMRALGNQPNFRNGAPQTPRQEFLVKFNTSERRHESQTSIQQALYFMNGKFVHDLTRVESNESLQTIVRSKRETTERKLQTLFLMALSRLPRPEERDRLEKYIAAGIAGGEESQVWSNIFWTLLNSAEFRLNH